MQWIGNERKRQGEVRRRASAKKSQVGVPCKSRKTSAYQLFKSNFFKSTLARTIKKTDGNSGLQQKANEVWKTLGVAELQAYEDQAQEANENSAPAKTETRKKRVKKLMSLIRDSIDQLNDFGCPSLWVGLSDGVPQRYFAEGVGALAVDETFINYTVSGLINSVAKKTMENETSKLTPLPGKKRKATKRTKKTCKETNSAIEAAGTEGTTNSQARVSSPKVDYFELLDEEEKVMCRGKKVERSVVHGRQLTQGWHAFEIIEVVDSSPKAWETFPGEIESGGYIAWPVANIRPVRSGDVEDQATRKKKRKEVRGLIDQLHPDFGSGSPSALAQLPRKSRAKNI
ncbi:hypothetical protein AC249_AIPGENE27471 [Exaiptasia diaphana]|nr:hypothetical protein AC249_AIPGENE27471 [Exaiptasia diaphana]